MREWKEIEVERGESEGSYKAIIPGAEPPTPGNCQFTLYLPQVLLRYQFMATFCYNGFVYRQGMAGS